MEEAVVTNLSFLPSFNKDKYVEFMELYEKGTRVERRKKFNEFSDDPAAPFGNTLREFIFDQLFLALEYSLKERFNASGAIALLEIMNEQFDDLLSVNPSEVEDFSSEMVSQKAFDQVQSKVQKYGNEVDYREWKLISEFISKHLLKDLNAYFYFFHFPPQMNEKSLDVSFYTPLEVFPPLPLTQKD